MSEENNTSENSENPSPVLYQRLAPLLTDVHKDLKLVKNQNFSFVANVNAVPIVMQELPMAAKFYPIVFASDAPGVMLAVMGIRNGENLFVDAEGKWREDTYIPAYIRRYPFFVARPGPDSDPVICIDEETSFLSPDGDLPLFKDGAPSEELKRAMEFTRTVQGHIEATVEFGEMAGEKDLLEDRSVEFKTGDEVKANVNGFKAINRTKFDELDGETLKDWLGKGWVDAVILHLASGGNFDRLWQMALKRNG